MLFTLTKRKLESTSRSIHNRQSPIQDIKHPSNIAEPKKVAIITPEAEETA